MLDHARNIATTVFHPVGTCAMGRERQSVVDDRLRVQGIERLRIADASIMPMITSGNTCAPVIMIGEKAADMIRADRNLIAAA
jgi:choline dehydrogenase